MWLGDPLRRMRVKLLTRFWPCSWRGVPFLHVARGIASCPGVHIILQTDAVLRLIALCGFDCFPYMGRRRLDLLATSAFSMPAMGPSLDVSRCANPSLPSPMVDVGEGPQGAHARSISGTDSVLFPRLMRSHSEQTAISPRPRYQVRTCWSRLNRT